MTKEISDKFEEPTRGNVEAGDYLVYFCNDGSFCTTRLVMYRVFAVTDNSLIYKTEGGLNEVPFNNSVVLKRSTGKCLLGEYIWNSLPEIERR